MDENINIDEEEDKISFEKPNIESLNSEIKGKKNNAKKKL